MHVRYVQSQHKDDKPPLKRGVVRVTRPTLKFDVLNDIPRTAEAGIIKFCVQVVYQIL